MATEVEGEVAGEKERLVGDRAVLTGLGHLLEGGVGGLHVGRVVLVVVQFHDLAGDVRLESCVVVGEFRQRVFRHEGPFFVGVRA